MLVFVLAMCASGIARSQSSEYEVKAAFIHNIAKFVEWPVNNNVMRLCIVGDDPFGGAADVLQGKPIEDARWQVVRPGADVDLRMCRVLFISTAESDRLSNILESIKDSPVLTVGDTSGYAMRGVMVNFYLEAQKVRFEINENAAMRAGLAISSRLLRLARIVKNGRADEGT